MTRAGFSIRPCPSAEAERLAAALGVQRITAEVLVRRGLGDPAAASAFLEQEGALHDPFLLGDMLAACELIEQAIAGGRRITVHGDYDVDGICATTLAVETLRALGADVGWHLPSRFDEGYGVAVETVDALADAGTSLLLTVDCGITAVEAVARARERGLAVVVSDHHRPGPELPDAPLVAARGPHAGRYPFPELCGTGVAFKLAQALWARRLGSDPLAVPPELARQLDLVALATVADVVELRDENRALVRAGMRRLARGERPGLAQLMRAASVDRARLRSSDIGFRLAPRINAAGRLGHPAVALELLLTTSTAAAEQGAQTLEALNRERQAVEESIQRAAVAVIESWPAERRAARGYVVWGEGWHEGVIGIVASRLVERYGRPVVVVAVDGDEAKGSGRSIPPFDLHAGLGACDEHLLRWGGHRAAAGLSLERGRLEAFAAAFAAHADASLGDDDLRRSHPVDAVVGVGELSLDLARELARLEPCGLGNPAVSLLVPAAQLAAVEAMGEGGRHLRLQVVGAGARCGAVAFGRGEDVEALRAPGRYDVVCRLQVNEWRGSVAPQLLLREALLAPQAGEARVAALAAADASFEPGADGAARVLDARGTSIAALIGRLAATGEATLVLVADVERRRPALAGPLEGSRFGAGEALFIGEEDGADGLAAALAALPGRRLAVADHWALEHLPELSRAFRHAVVLDPPAHPAAQAVLDALPGGVDVHVAYGPRELELVRRLLETSALRPLLASLWRAAPVDEPLAAGDVARLLRQATPEATAAAIARCAAVLLEVGLAERLDSGQLVLRRPAGKVDLEASPTYVAAELRRSESLAHLDALGRPRTLQRPALAVA